MFTGSVAMNYYAFPKMTRDIDIVIELHHQDLSAFVGLFQDGFYLFPDSIKEAVANREMFNIIHNKHVIKLDIAYISRWADEIKLQAIYRKAIDA